MVDTVSHFLKKQNTNALSFILQEKKSLEGIISQDS